MKPKTIGIVSGAGPLAGVALLDRLFRYAQTDYGCFRDEDFPQVLLISFPFSDMLGDCINRDKVANELREALQFLKQSGAELLAIACNTLHTFLDSKIDECLLSLPQATTEEIKLCGDTNPLILCTSTSRTAKLYDALFPCTYPDIFTQKEVDAIIVEILKGNPQACTQLAALIDRVEAETIVLGCTELSLYANLCTKRRVIDPLEMLAKKLITKSFSQGRAP